MSLRTGEEAVADDEILLRRIPGRIDYFDPALIHPVTPLAFKPNEKDQGGLSLFRERFATPQEIVANSRGNIYYFARLRAGDLRKHGMEVLPDPTDASPGHAVIGNLTHANRKSKESRERMMLLSTKLILGEVIGPICSQ